MRVCDYAEHLSVECSIAFVQIHSYCHSEDPAFAEDAATERSDIFHSRG